MRMLAKLLLTTVAGAVAFPVLAGTPINQTRPLEPRGRVEIENVKGRVEVVAWDRPEVKLTGTLGDGVEKLSVEGDARVLRIKVQYPTRSRNAEPSDLVVQMPVLADLDIETVSADINVSGMASRELEIESVSGDIVASGAPRQGSVSSVSGDIRLAMNSASLKVETVSGQLTAQGRLNGEIALESVSGDVRFAFDPTLEAADLATVPVRRLEAGGPVIEEEYSLDENGIVAVRITNLDAGVERVFRLGATG